jgi:hypothetical protein
VNEEENKKIMEFTLRELIFYHRHQIMKPIIKVVFRPHGLMKEWYLSVEFFLELITCVNEIFYPYGIASFLLLLSAFPSSVQ